MATNINFKNLTKINFNGVNLTKVILKQGSTSTVVWTGERDWSAFENFVPKLGLDGDYVTFVNYNDFAAILANLGLTLDDIHIGVVYKVSNHATLNNSTLARQFGLPKTKILWNKVWCDDTQNMNGEELKTSLSTETYNFVFNIYPETTNRCILKGVTEFVQYKSWLGKQSQFKYYGINGKLKNTYHGHKFIGLILSDTTGETWTQPDHHTQISANAICLPGAEGFFKPRVVQKDSLVRTYKFESYMAFLPHDNGDWWPKGGHASNAHNAFGFVDGDKITTTTDGKCQLWRKNETDTWQLIETWVYKPKSGSATFKALTFENIQENISIDCIV